MANLFDREVTVPIIEGVATVVDAVYRIVTQVTLDFTTAGAPNNTVDTVFFATSIKTLGIGDELAEITAPKKSIPDIDPFPALAILRNSGTSTDNTFYRIMTQSIVDFTSIGSADNNVGTYFYSNAAGAALTAVDALAEIQVSWVPATNNLISIDETEDAFRVDYVDAANGAVLTFRKTSDLSADLVIGKTYKLRFEGKRDSVTAVGWRVWKGTSFSTQVNFSAVWAYYELEFICANVTGCSFNFIAMGGTDAGLVRNFSLNELGGVSMGMSMSLRTPLRFLHRIGRDNA